MYISPLFLYLIGYMHICLNIVLSHLSICIIINEFLISLIVYKVCLYV